MPPVAEGLPIAYLTLDEGVPVYASDGAQLGTVDHVVAAPEKDIFHGIVMKGHRRQYYIAADDVASLHERGVDLRIDSEAAADLPAPHGAAPAWHDREPGVKPTPWKHILDRFTGADPRKQNWTKED